MNENEIGKGVVNGIGHAVGALDENVLGVLAFLLELATHIKSGGGVRAAPPHR